MSLRLNELATRKIAARRRGQILDSHMNEEWANDHTSSVAAFDMEVLSPMAQLHDLKLDLIEKAAELERKIKRAAMSPFLIMRSVLRVVQK